ncbi:MAG: PTS sugar transporter subunit IIA [Lentisphaeria bacterium]|nr:PTS sugar transporter subunit IIA [Lentisphaeria bacterium]
MDDSSDGEFRLSGRLAPERCAVLECAGKNETLDALIDLLAPFAGSGGRAGLAEAIYAREKLLSTGIGLGIAIPHVRLSTAEDLTAAAALVHDGVSDYGSVDSIPVRLVVMIVARADQHELYLRVLSRLSTSLKDDAFRDRVFHCASARELYGLLGEC